MIIMNEYNLNNPQTCSLLLNVKYRIHPHIDFHTSPTSWNWYSGKSKQSQTV